MGINTQIKTIHTCSDGTTFEDKIGTMVRRHFI